MRGLRNKTTPRVKNGRVQRKNYRDVREQRAGGPLQIRVEVPRQGRHFLTERHLRSFIRLIPEWEELSLGVSEILLDDHNERADGWYESGTVAICAWEERLAVSRYAWYFEEHRPLFEKLNIRVEQQRRFVGSFACNLGIEYAEEEILDFLKEEYDLISSIDLMKVRDGEWAAIDRDEGITFCDCYAINGSIHVYDRVFRCRFTPEKVRAYQLLHIFLHELGHHRDAMKRPEPGWCVRGEDYAEQWARRHADRVWDRYFASNLGG